MIKETVWKPDTCGCSYVYSWDSEAPEGLRVHSFARVEKACPAHTSDEVGYLAGLVENRRKNIAIGRARNVLGDIFNDGGLSWTFNVDRTVITVSFGGQLTRQQVSRVQAAADLLLGPGVVVIEG